MEIHLELLLGEKVHDADGKSAGRIEEAVARKQNNEWVVTEFHLGSSALLERLSIRHLGLATLATLGAKKTRPGGALCVPWDKMDLSDPYATEATMHCRGVAGAGAMNLYRLTALDFT